MYHSSVGDVATGGNEMPMNQVIQKNDVFSLCLNRFSVVNIIRLHGCQIFPKMPEKILLIKIKPTLFELLQVGRLWTRDSTASDGKRDDIISI